jgi:hypothetical protein
MSTDYRALIAIPFRGVFDGRLDKYGIREIIKSDTSESLRYLCGKDGILNVYKEQGGTDCSFERPSFAPMPWVIFDALTEEFGTAFVSEHDHRYWGFDTAEGWNAFQDKLAIDDDDDLYRNILLFFRGKSHELIPGTIGFAQAEIALELIQKDPRLAEPDWRVALFAMITEIFERENPPLKVELTRQDLARVDLIMSRTDDLPKA